MAERNQERQEDRLIMKLIDSNILIYAAQPQYPDLKELLLSNNAAVSNISRLEVLSWPKITNDEVDFFNAIFSVIRIMEVDNEVINEAIIIRKNKMMKVGDAIIGATALLYSFELITRNVEEIKHLKIGISGLITGPLILIMKTKRKLLK